MSRSGIAGWVLGCALSLALPVGVTASTGTAPGCPPASHDRAALDALKASGFQLDDADRRAALALDLLPCLAHPDPGLRDGIAFEAYYTWMRGQQLTPATLDGVRTGLLALLKRARADAEDPGFAAPFAALVLAEIVRTDRLAPWLNDEQGGELLDLGVAFLTEVRDYRGFDAREGWRHGVAHGADLVLQLAAHPQVDGTGQRRLLAAVAAQVQPATATHFYIYGEPERLARPFVVIAGRDQVPVTELADWLSQVAAPGPLGAWGAAYQSQEGLARRHNIGNFLKSVLTALPEQERYAPLAKRVRELIAAM